MIKIKNYYTKPVKMKINVENAEKIFKKAIKLLEGECPKETCEWCEGRWVMILKHLDESLVEGAKELLEWTRYINP